MGDICKFEEPRLASLATVDTKGPFSCPVYFVHDNESNIYFISSDASRHVARLKDNPAVGISIYDPQKALKNLQTCLEIRGVATRVPGQDRGSLQGKKTPFTGITMFDSSGHDGYFVRAHHGVFVMIKPTEISYVNTELFGGEVMHVPLNEL